MQQIIQRGLMAGQGQVLRFQLTFKFRNLFGIPFCSARDAIHHVQAEMQLGGLGQIAAVAGGVKDGPH